MNEQFLDNIINMEVNLSNLTINIPNKYSGSICGLKIQDKKNWTKDSILKMSPPSIKIGYTNQLIEYQDFLNLLNIKNFDLLNFKRPLFINLVIGHQNIQTKNLLNLSMSDLIFKLTERVNLINEWEDDQYYEYEDNILKDITSIKNIFQNDFKDNNRYIRLIVRKYKIKNNYWDFIFSKIKLNSILLCYLDGDELVFEIIKNGIVSAISCLYSDIDYVLHLYGIDKNILIPVFQGGVGIQLMMTPIEPMVSILNKGG